MIKQIILLFNLIGLLAYQSIFNLDVNIEQTAPEKINPGSSFNVQLKITNMGVDGFAKIQQELPAGVTAEVIESKGATFSFKEQVLKFIWMKLPVDNEFTVTYKITVSENASSPIPIGGQFAYISNNERKSVDIPLISVEISDAPILANTSGEEILENTSSSAEASVAAIVNDPNGKVVCARRIKKESPSVYTVEIGVRKKELVGFAKIEDLIPEGYEVIEVQSSGGIFSFKKQEVKILWLTVPSSDVYSIKYRVVALANVKGEATITGSFSYLEGEDPKKIIISPTVFDENGQINGLSDVEFNNLMNPLGEGSEVDAIIAQNNVQTEEKEESTKEESNTTTVNVATSEEGTLDNAALVKANQEMEASGEVVIETVKEQAAGDPEIEGVAVKPKGITSIPSPDANVYYKIQIAAGHDKISNDYFMKLYKVDDNKVSVEQHEGWRKYTIDKFSQYKDARNSRNNYWESNKITDAFVTAYNNGSRITVQEALMITNQKWFY